MPVKTCTHTSVLHRFFLPDIACLQTLRSGPWLSWQDVFLLLHALMVRHHVSLVLKPSPDEAGFDLGVKWSLGLSVETNFSSA